VYLEKVKLGNTQELKQIHATKALEPKHRDDMTMEERKWHCIT